MPYVQEKPPLLPPADQDADGASEVALKVPAAPAVEAVAASSTVVSVAASQVDYRAGRRAASPHGGLPARSPAARRLGAR